MQLPYRPALLMAALFATTLASAKTLIHAGSLIDGRADTVRHAVTLTVEGERLTGIAEGYTAAGAARRDARPPAIPWIRGHRQLPVSRA